MKIEIKFIQPKKSTKVVRAHRVLVKEFPDLELYTHIAPTINRDSARRYTISLKSGVSLETNGDFHFAISIVKEIVEEYGTEAIKQHEKNKLKEWEASE